MPIPQIGPLPPVPPQGFAPDLLGQLLQSAVSGYTQGQLQKPEYERLITEKKLREIQLQTEQQKQLQETLQTMLPLLQGNPALLQDPTVQAKLSDLFKGLNIPIPPGGITPRTVATLAYGPKERATILDKLPDLLAMPPDARRAYAQTMKEETGIDLPDGFLNAPPYISPDAALKLSAQVTQALYNPNAGPMQKLGALAALETVAKRYGFEIPEEAKAAVTEISQLVQARIDELKGRTDMEASRSKEALARAQDLLAHGDYLGALKTLTEAKVDLTKAQTQVASARAQAILAGIEDSHKKAFAALQNSEANLKRADALLQKPTVANLNAARALVTNLTTNITNAQREIVNLQRQRLAVESAIATKQIGRDEGKKMLDEIDQRISEAQSGIDQLKALQQQYLQIIDDALSQQTSQQTPSSTGAGASQAPAQPTPSQSPPAQPAPQSGGAGGGIKTLADGSKWRAGVAPPPGMPPASQYPNQIATTRDGRDWLSDGTTWWAQVK